jgi:hypothetical protein
MQMQKEWILNLTGYRMGMVKFRLPWEEHDEGDVEFKEKLAECDNFDPSKIPTSLDEIRLEEKKYDDGKYEDIKTVGISANIARFYFIDMVKALHYCHNIIKVFLILDNIQYLIIQLLT